MATKIRTRMYTHGIVHGQREFSPLQWRGQAVALASRRPRQWQRSPGSLTPDHAPMRGFSAVCRSSEHLPQQRSRSATPLLPERRFMPEITSRAVMIDTNVALRRSDRASTQHQARNRRLGALSCCGCSKFLVVATQPVGGQGSGSVPRSKSNPSRSGSCFCCGTTSRRFWQKYVLAHRVIRARIHDARLAAAMWVHGFAPPLRWH